MSRVRRSPAALLLALATLLGVAEEVSAQVLLLTSDLRLLRGEVTRIGPSSVAYRDADGQDIFLPAEQCLGIVDLTPRPSARRDPGLLVLRDGQRLPGRPDLRQGRLAWVNPLLGAVRLDLEQLRGLSLRSGVEPPTAADRDVVLLSNGDRIEGIVESIGVDVLLSAEPTGAGQGGAAQEAAVLRVPLERVEAIGLVTPQGSGSGSRVWLEDGTVADVERPIVEGDGIVHLRGFLEGAETRAHGLPLTYLRGVRFSTGGFVPLGALPPSRVSVPLERLVAPMPEVIDPHAPLELSSMRLSGPIEVSWTLPPGIRRLVSGVRVPTALRDWTDLELVILDGQGERLRRTISGGEQTEPIDVVLRDGILTIRLDEGRRGPVGDSIVLETPLLGRVQ